MTFKVLVVLAVAACVLDGVRSRTVVTYNTSDSPAPETAPKVHVGADGVSASFGGYSASAGLGGSIGAEKGAGGVLFARAGTPGGLGASAGLGGSLNSGGEAQGGLAAGATTGGSSIGTNSDGGSSSSSGTGSGFIKHTQVTTIQKPRPSNPNLYNDIFNIPTSILASVNRLLNNGVSQVLRTGGGGVHAGAAVGGNKDAGIGTRVGAGAFVETGSTGSTGTTVTKEVSTGFFNDIFNIPITALNAVNQLLNNKNGK